MRISLSSLALLALLPMTALAEDHYGQYTCLVNRSVGIIHSGDQIYAGQITLPSGRRQFFMHLQPVAPDPQTISLCRDSISYYLKILESRLPYSVHTPAVNEIGPRAVLGDHCFMRDEINLQYPMGETAPFQDEALNLRSYGDDMGRDHFSDINGNWLKLTPDGRFVLVLQYANGPSIEDGQCRKVDPEH
jgi:hypothetical protein